MYRESHCVERFPREREIDREEGRERGNLVAIDQCHFNGDTYYTLLPW